MSEKRYYTVTEANAHVKGLSRLFANVMQLRAQLKRMYQSLDNAGYPPSQDDDELYQDAPIEIVRDRARFEGLVEALREQVDEIHDTGCQIKDIETGLVDWLGRFEDRDILLCWQFGEKEVSHWHETYAGFAGRRPVTELDGR